jgi:hypothetical protein
MGTLTQCADSQAAYTPMRLTCAHVIRAGLLRSLGLLFSSPLTLWLVVTWQVVVGADGVKSKVHELLHPGGTARSIHRVLLIDDEIRVSSLCPGFHHSVFSIHCCDGRFSLFASS